MASPIHLELLSPIIVSNLIYPDDCHIIGRVMPLSCMCPQTPKAVHLLVVSGSAHHY